MFIDDIEIFCGRRLHSLKPFRVYIRIISGICTSPAFRGHFIDEVFRKRADIFRLLVSFWLIDKESTISILYPGSFRVSRDNGLHRFQSSIDIPEAKLKPCFVVSSCPGFRVGIDIVGKRVDCLVRPIHVAVDKTKNIVCLDILRVGFKFFACFFERIVQFSLYEIDSGELVVSVHRGSNGENRIGCVSEKHLREFDIIERFYASEEDISKSE